MNLIDVNRESREQDDMGSALDQHSTVEVERSSLSTVRVFEFFNTIMDVNDLGPAEEASEAWEAFLDGERVGMAVVDTFPSEYGFVYRVAVVKQHRRNGIAAALLSRLYREYGRLVCRVHTDNGASQSLVESQGFVRTGLGRYEKLIRYDTDEESGRTKENSQ